MGSCCSKKNNQSVNLYSHSFDSLAFNPPTNYGASLSYGAATSSPNTAATKKAETTIQLAKIKTALAKLQNLLQGCEIDEFVDELAQCHSEEGVPLEEYQRIMNAFESGMIPALYDGGLGWQPTRRPPKIANQNVLLNALQNVAGGWTAAEDNDLDHEEYLQADHAVVETQIETKREEGDDDKEEEPFCFKDYYIDVLTSCPEGCKIEAVEGLASKSTFKDIPEAKVKVDKSFLKTLRKELRSLKRNLLLTPENSMFVRYDEDRPQFMRAVITGNSDSPYAYGAFLFDIFLPANYPTVPLKITHITPGATNVHANNGPGGFSPNMHQATGKICLSLLGTWAGPGWDPKKSNVYQVLSTICFAILSVEHPYYMEPNFGGWEGTAPTSNHAAEVIQYTEEVEGGCVEYAMMGPLTKPYEYFEEVLAAHFAATRLRIATTVDKWIGKTTKTSHHKRIQDNRDKLLMQLEKVTDTVSKWEDSAVVLTTK